MKYKIHVLLLICCCAGFRMTAQDVPNQFDLKKMLPTSPEAAMMSRFGDIPVGYYTGVADISIPLYTIKEKDMEIPIMLRYHGSGVKVDDLGSSVGLGWSLDPGGSIIQVVNGVPDAMDELTTAHSAGYDFLMESIPVSGVTSSRYQIGTEVFNGDCYNPPPYIPGDDVITTNALLNGHGQPDLYIFNLPGGHSGKFYLHPVTLEPIQLNKKGEFKIERIGWYTFIITTLDGNIFTFDILETTSGMIYTDYTGRTFKLSSIVLPNGRFIDFTFINGFYSWLIFNQSFHSDYALSVGFPSEYVVKTHADASSHNTKNLSRITTNDVWVDFKYEDRDDMITTPDNDGDPANGTLNAKRIKSVEITSRVSGLKIKSYNFSYGYFNYTGGAGYHSYYSFPYDKLGKRLKLISLQEVGYNSAGQPVTLVPPYQFSYDESAVMPMKTSYARDYWGYYNGQDLNSTVLPDLSYFYFDGAYSHLSQDILYRFDRANRAPNKQTMGLYSLNKITYPTGGFSIFEYEPHSFYLFNYPDQNKMDTARRVLDVVDQNESYNIKSVHFKLPVNRQIKLSLTVSSGSIAQGLNFYNVSSSTVSIYGFNGGVKTHVQTWQLDPAQEAEFNLNRGLTWNVMYSVTSFYDSLELKVELPDNLGQQNDFNKGASVRAVAQYYDMSRLAEPKVSYGGGLRVKSIRNFTENGRQVSHKVLKYVNADSSISGKLMSRLQYTHDVEMHFEVRGSLPGQVLAERRWVTFLSAESNIPFSDGAGGSTVGYSRVEELNYDSANYSSNGRRIFTYWNEESVSGPNTPDQPDYRNGLLYKEEIKDASGNTLNTTDYVYGRREYSTNMGIKANKNYIHDYSCDDITATLPKPDGYLYLYYPLRTEWYVLDSVERKEFAGGVIMTSKEKYNYNANGLRTQDEVKNSKGETIRNNYIYHTEAPYTNEGQLLRIAGMQNTLIEQVKRKVLNGVATELARTYVQYRKEHGVVVQSAIRNSVNGEALRTDILFDAYGEENILKQVTEREKMRSLLWSERNIYPVAVAQNATHTQIAFTSFEDNAKGNWNYNQAAVTSTFSFTGGKSYSLSSSNAIGSNGLATSDYIISYRSRNTTPFTINGTTGAVINGGVVDGWTYFQHRVSNQGAFTITGTGIIDDVRLYPVTAELATYVYQPGVGVIANTDAKGTTAFYEYDAFNRLKLIRDQEGKILKQFDYQYNVNP